MSRRRRRSRGFTAGTGIVPVIETTLSLPVHPSSPGRARRFVRDVLAAWGAARFEEPATLLTSELVTNAVLHARSRPELKLRLTDNRLWVGVADNTPVSPVRKRYGPEAATGRGLMLVERMAAAWGTTVTAQGKVVWFELSPEAGEATGLALEAEALADLADLGLTGGIDDSPNRDRSGPAGPHPRTRRPPPPGRWSTRR
jgi:anti-sigma regulatory factor (Ser/Thr protein kinase)